MAKSRYAQTWTHILRYLKRELGTGVNLLEMSDDEIIEGLDEDVLSLFSQYAPHKDYLFITPANLKTDRIPGEPKYQYLLETDKHIIDIYEVMPNSTGEFMNELGTEHFDIQSRDVMIDVVLSNAYMDASKSLSVQNTWMFRPPNILDMDKEITRAVVIYNTPHEDPKTIRPDAYNTMFRPLCLGYVQRWLAAKRSKFENVSTPFGTINLNWQKLETDSQTNIQESMQKLELIPPDKLVEFT